MHNRHTNTPTHIRSEPHITKSQVIFIGSQVFSLIKVGMLLNGGLVVDDGDDDDDDDG